MFLTPATLVSVCMPGYQLQGTECQPCVKGSYKALASNEQCQPCPRSRTTPGTAATSETQCGTDISSPLCCVIIHSQQNSCFVTCPEMFNLFPLFILATTVCSTSVCGVGEQFSVMTGLCEPCPLNTYQVSSPADLLDQCLFCSSYKLNTGNGVNGSAMVENCGKMSSSFLTTENWKQQQSCLLANQVYTKNGQHFCGLCS